MNTLVQQMNGASPDPRNSSTSSWSLCRPSLHGPPRGTKTAGDGVQNRSRGVLNHLWASIPPNCQATLLIPLLLIVRQTNLEGVYVREPRPSSCSSPSPNLSPSTRPSPSPSPSPRHRQPFLAFKTSYSNKTRASRGKRLW